MRQDKWGLVKHISTAALTSALLLGFIARSRTAQADEFIVAHSGADTAFSQQKLDGSGVTVAIVDSGINAVHWDLAQSGSKISRVKTSVNFVPNSTVISDLCGHGTHVAGIVAGNGASSTGNTFYRTFYGIARNANLVNVRVLDDKGAGTVSSVIAGIQWCIANKSTYGIRVINLSLGHEAGESYKTDPLCQAVETLWKAGIFVSVSPA